MTDGEGMESKQIDTDGGAGIDGGVDTDGGDFIGRDQIIIGNQVATIEELFQELTFRLYKISIIIGNLIYIELSESHSNYHFKSGVLKLGELLSGTVGGGSRFRNEPTDFLIHSLNRMPSMGTLDELLDTVILMDLVSGELSLEERSQMTLNEFRTEYETKIFEKFLEILNKFLDQYI